MKPGSYDVVTEGTPDMAGKLTPLRVWLTNPFPKMGFRLTTPKTVPSSDNVFCQNLNQSISRKFPFGKFIGLFEKSATIHSSINPYFKPFYHDRPRLRN